MQHQYTLLIMLMVVALTSFTTADIMVYEFYQTTCPHCQNVIQSGILETVDAREDVTVETYETTTPGGYLKYQEMQEKLTLKPGVPLVVIECKEGKYIQIIGDTPIITTLESSIDRCYAGDYDVGGNNTFYYFIATILILGIAYFYFFHYKKQ